jgi:hypothetical protein
MRLKNVSSSLKSLASLLGESASGSLAVWELQVLPLCHLLPDLHSSAKAAAPIIIVKNVAITIKIIIFLIEFSSNTDTLETLFGQIERD